MTSLDISNFTGDGQSMSLIRLIFSFADRLIRGALGSVYALRHSPSGLLSIAEETKQQTEEREKGNIRGYVSHNDSPLATLPVTGEGTLNWVVVLETYTYLETRLSKFNMDSEYH